MGVFERKLRSTFDTFRVTDARLVEEVRIILSGHREMLLRELAVDGLALARSLADTVDDLVGAWFDAAGRGRELAVVALGGYGRGELNPSSDVDLLVLYPAGAEAVAEDLTGPLLAFLWDLGYEVGHSVRSLAGVAEAMDEDLPTATALAEARFLAGSRVLFRRAAGEVVNPWLERHGVEFVEQKIEEARARHRFYGDTPLVVTPNVKEGAGGLRDMHVAGWIGLAISRRKDFRVFREAGLIDEDESKELLDSYSFVHRVRNALHVLAGRRQDVLGPEVRCEIADRLEIDPGEGRSETEELMRRYYRAAIVVSRFLDRVIRFRFSSSLEEPRLRIGEGFLAVGGEVYPEGDGALDTPRQALFALDLMLEKGLTASPELESAIRRIVPGIDTAVRFDAGTAEAFLSLLSRQRAGAALRILDRTGFLGAYLPEYGRLSGLTREDPHHTFTVDEHTLRAVEACDALAQGGAPPKGEWRWLERPELLRLALLLHDAGKARGGHHPKRGGWIVSDVTERLGLSDEDSDLVHFLVRHHLLMTSLVDRLVLGEAADQLVKAVRDRRRLDALYLLTLSDVAAVGKGTLSGWRRAQLTRLFANALSLLSDRPPLPRIEEVLESTGPERREEVEDHFRKMGRRYVLEVEPARVALHLDLVRRLSEGPVAVACLSSDSYSEIHVAAPDRPGLFAAIAGVLTLADLTIGAAHAYTREDGIVLDGFFVTGEGHAEKDLAARIETSLVDVLAGSVDLEDRLASHRRRFRLEEPPPAACQPLGASISEPASNRYVAAEVVALDRPGLLYDLARAVSAAGLSIQHAIVSTRGPEVTDTFYVLCPDHMIPYQPMLEDLVARLDAVARQPDP